MKSTIASKKNTQPVATFSPKLLIIDDDPVVTAVMKARLSNQFPACKIQTSKDPVVLPDCEIYLIDNDFNGQSLAIHLLRQIRKLNPNALVVAMSSTLNMVELERLMNGGCNAVYNKCQPQASKEVFEVISNYLNALKKQQQSNGKNRVIDVVHSLQELLAQWNKRLSQDIS
jgi:DNA-binding NarL/FixJ family response regulator